MDDDIKKLNPSVNYDDSFTGILNNNDLLIQKHILDNERKQNNKTFDEDTFYKYFSIIMTFIFMVIILNVTFVAYKTIDPTAFDSCKDIISNDIIDVFSSVDDTDSAERALIRWNPKDYDFEEYKIENCGRNGLFAYYFKDGNSTYIVCDDDTIQYFEKVCEEPRFMKKMLISLVTIFN
ncbi:MAG: hypothetical protein K0B07_05275 [DPANN group archaeon]|nr:hypothetical protein [DPANN group archaeon]